MFWQQAGTYWIFQFFFFQTWQLWAIFFPQIPYFFWGGSQIDFFPLILYINSLLCL